VALVLLVALRHAAVYKFGFITDLRDGTLDVVVLDDESDEGVPGILKLLVVFLELGSVITVASVVRILFLDHVFNRKLPCLIDGDLAIALIKDEFGPVEQRLQHSDTLHGLSLLEKLLEECFSFVVVVS
jgi:hypothetical protein